MFKLKVPKDSPYEKLAKTVPIAAAEFQKQLIPPHLRHKDELKLAVQLTVCLLTWVKVLMPFGPRVCEELCLPGLLFGGFDVAICAVRAKFDELYEIDDGEEVWPVTIIFETSKRTGRCSIHKTNIYNYDSTSADYGNSKNTFEFVKAAKEAVLKNKTGIELDIEEALRTIEAEDNQLEYMNLEIDKCKSEESAAEEILSRIDCNDVPTFAELKVIFEHMMNSQDFEINEEFIFALCRIKNMAIRQAMFIIEQCNKCQGDYFSGDPNKKFLFKFPSSRTLHVPEVGPAHQFTPMKRNYSEYNLHTPSTRRDIDVEMASIHLNDATDMKLEWREPHYWKSETGTPLVSVLKRFNRYEPEIYASEIIRRSNFFARLVSYEPYLQEEPKGAIITLEAETCTLSQLSPEIMSQLRLHPKWYATSLAVHMIMALTELHDAGYVHSNISPDNICFNVRQRTWKLIDFGNAWPLEDSLITRRPLDESPYLSDESLGREKVEPIDDFINLANVICYGFPEAFDDCNFHNIYAHFTKSLEEARKEADKEGEVWRADVDLLHRALMHHKVICQHYDCPDDTTLQMFEPVMKLLHYA